MSTYIFMSEYLHVRNVNIYLHVNNVNIYLHVRNVNRFFVFGHIDVEAPLKDLIGAVENAALVNIPEIITIKQCRNALTVSRLR